MQPVRLGLISSYTIVDYKLEQYFSLTPNQPAVIIYNPAAPAEQADEEGLRPAGSRLPLFSTSPHMPNPRRWPSWRAANRQLQNPLLTLRTYVRNGRPVPGVFGNNAPHVITNLCCPNHHRGKPTHDDIYSPFCTALVVESKYTSTQKGRCWPKLLVVFVQSSPAPKWLTSARS